MSIDRINPFIMAIENVFQQFGITILEKSSIQYKEEMMINQDVTAFVGIVGDIKGNVAYSFTNDVAKNIASIMMMGMPIDELNSMARSALAELSNMITGMAASILAENDLIVDITPPSLVSGIEMYLILTFLNTESLVLKTSVGSIELNIAVEG